MKKNLKILAELTKIKITLFVTITTAFGYICYSGEINRGLIAPVLGILLLACGSAAVNHYQERKTDALMDRTKNRPIPSGRISALNALMIAVTLSVIGSLILYVESGLIPLLLALLNLV